MAFVLSHQENMDLLLLLAKIAVSVGAIAVFLLLWFWVRLKRLEKRLYRSRRPIRARVSRNIPARNIPANIPANIPTRNIPARKMRQIVEPVSHQLSTSTRNLTVSRPPVPTTQVYRPKTSVTAVKKSYRPDNLPLRSHWILAILLASITGMAIAIMQLGNSLISPELMPFLWFFIGFMLIVSATFVKSA